MHKLNFSFYRALPVVVLLLAAVAAALPAHAQSTGGVKGKVRTPAGDGVANASVTARQKGVDLKSVKADSKGNFLMEGLESGRYNLVFDASGYSSGVLYNIEVKKKKVIDLGDRLILSADQGTLVLIKGSVFYNDGTSIMGAKVELEKVNADGSTQRLGSSATSSSGEFTFRRPTGKASLRITAKFKGVSGSKVIEVDDAAIYRLAISLDLTRERG